MARSGILRERETGGRTRVPPPQGEQHALFSLCAHNSTKGEIMYSRMNLHIYIYVHGSRRRRRMGWKKRKTHDRPHCYEPVRRVLSACAI